MQLSQSPSPFNIYIEKTIKILAKTVGRDKVIRFWQYISLFIAYTKFGGQQKTKDLQNPRWAKASAQFRSARKVLRFLRTMEFSKKIMALIKQLKNNGDLKPIDKLINIGSILSNLSTLLFFVFDHRVFLAQIGVIDQAPLKKNFRLSFIFWFLECVFTVITDLLKYSKLKKQTPIDQNKNQNKALISTVSDLSLDIIKNIADSIIALSQIRQDLLKPQQIGALGTITSLIGLNQMYQNI